jgi:FAD dependent oxidoreductase
MRSPTGGRAGQECGNPDNIARWRAGATAGGVMAAVAAAKDGASVILLEPGRHVGGMMSGGLGWTDMDSAGTAAALSVRSNAPLHKLDLTALQRRLAEQRQILSWEGRRP